MRTLTLIIALAILSGCKSHKQSATSVSIESQTSASTERYHLATEVDSIFRSLSFAFDTLEINIIQPNANPADSSLIISVKAVNGFFSREKNSSRHKAETDMINDTLSIHQTDSLSTSSDTTTTLLFSPPNFLTALIVVIICFIFLYTILRSIRKKH